MIVSSDRVGRFGLALQAKRKQAFYSICGLAVIQGWVPFRESVARVFVACRWKKMLLPANFGSNLHRFLSDWFIRE
jgi:hypothetical protein